MSLFNARALATLVAVAGSALSRRVTIILETLVKEEERLSDDEEELQDAITEAETAVLASIQDPEGLNTVMMLLLSWLVSESCVATTLLTISLGSDTNHHGVVQVPATCSHSFARSASLMHRSIALIGSVNWSPCWMIVKSKSTLRRGTLWTCS
jgi:hypothetical protein